MAESAERDPVLDDWRDNLAGHLRSIMAIDRTHQSELARAMSMKQAALSRRLLGHVSFKAEELLFLMDWMNRNIDEAMAAAKVRKTNPCLSHSDSPPLERLTWAANGYIRAGYPPSMAYDLALDWYTTRALRTAA